MDRRYGYLYQTLGRGTDAAQQQNAVVDMLRTREIKRGKWRTVETFWNAGAIAYFRAPAGARIKVRYGVGWFGFDRQKQVLDGNDFKKLSVGRGSIARARFQVKVEQTQNVTYDVYPGGTSITTPPIRF
jgi:hypothetical protein